jgi:RimJ/RimL family protein N-acetyltransferase
MTSPVFFESERLVYRGLDETQHDRLWSWINHPDVRRYLDHRVAPIGRKAESAWIDGEATAFLPARPAYRYFVEERDSGDPVGTTGLEGVHWVARSAEWGILIDPDKWNRGFGREMARRMLRHAFDDLNLNRIHLRVCVEHEAALRAYAAAGFVREGLLREALWLDDRFRDAVVMSVLRGDPAP